MKAIVGVDNDGLYKAALSLLGRLQFPSAEVELIHTSEPLPPYPDSGFVASPEVEEVLETTAEKVLIQAQEVARADGLVPTRHEYVVGPVSGCLMNAADAADADIIAIGSHEKSPVSAFFLGSVGRGLTISAKQSVLISKGHVSESGAVTAIVATDYSDYAKKALQHLVEMKPAGLAKLVLVTAVETAVTPDPTVLRIVEREDSERQFYLDEGEKMVAYLKDIGIDAEAHVLTADVHHCIEENMREASADLIIFGAHGHGFLERLVHGSTSLRESLMTHHPVLIVRAP